MKAFIKWILLVIGCTGALFTSVVYILQYVYNVDLEWKSWVYGLSYSISIISILLSTMAHTQQQKSLDKINTRMRDLVERPQENNNTENGWLEPDYQSSAIVDILLYAMYKANSAHPFSIERILPDDVQLVTVLVNGIFSSYKKDILFGYINNNNLLVVDTFDRNKIPVKIDGRSYGNHYDNKTKKQICDARKRIEAAANE